MHARMITRNISKQWRRISIIAVITLTAQFVLLHSQQAHAELKVSYSHIEQSRSFESTRTYAGQTVAARATELGFKRGGEIASLNVDIGDRVTAGAVLAQLDNRALLARQRQAEANVALSRANLQALEAETQLAINTERRLRALRKQGHVSQQTYDETRLQLRAKQAQLDVARATLLSAQAAADAARVDVDETTVRAPFDGAIQARYVDEGAQVGAGQATLRLVEDQRPEAHIGVPSVVAETLSPGQTFNLKWQTRNFPVSLRAVLPELDPNTRTRTAVLELNDANIPLGVVVELSVNQAIAANGYWLPVSALTAADRGLWGVFVINRDDIVERRLVEIVHTEADRVFVRGTLDHLDRVVQTGVQRIVPGQKVVPETAVVLSYAG